MKRIISIILTMIMLLSLCSNITYVSASENKNCFLDEFKVVQKDGWEYYLDRSTGNLYRKSSENEEILFENYFVTNIVQIDEILTVIMYDNYFNTKIVNIINGEISGNEQIELFTENSNEKKIFNFCVNEMKLNVAAACAVLANIKAESNFNPNAIGDKGTSYGICQWHNGRWTNLKKYCKKNNYDWKSIDGQLRYLHYELKNKYEYVWNNLKNTKNSASGANSAAKYWCARFEVPAGYGEWKNGELIYGPTSKARGESAKTTYWGKYNNQTISIETEDDLAYPTQNVSFSNWTENGFVHDISVPVGTPVYAIADGTIKCTQKYANVKGKNKLVSYGNQINFTSTDKSIKATYAHLDSFKKTSNLFLKSDQTAQLSAKEITVKTKNLGTYTVSKGEIIGYSGNTGNSSGPHLHFELRINDKRVNPPKYLSNGIDEGETKKYKKSTNYPVPLICYTDSATKVTTYYGSVNSKTTGYIDGKNDECNVKEFYTNGYAKVTYSGVKGFAYIPVKSLIKNSISTYKTTAKSKQTVYKRSDLKESYGTVDASTQVTVVGKKDNKLQIIFATGKTYKMAWISKDKLNKTKDEDIKNVNNSNLKTPIYAYTTSTEKVYTYNKPNGDRIGYIDGAKDLCIIKSISDDGWLKVSYPISSGNKTGYVKASTFAEDLYTCQSAQALKNQTVYRRKNLKESIGEVYKNDTVHIVDIDSDKVQIVYPIKNGYKMGWMKLSNLKPVVSNIKLVKKDDLKVVRGQRINNSLFDVVLEFLGGSTKVLSAKSFLMEENTDGYEINTLSFDEVGTQTLSVSYTPEDGNTVYADEFIEVIKPNIESLKIKEYPNKCDYIEGQSFDANGLKVAVVFEDGTTELIDDYDIVLGGLEPGVNVVTIYYEEFSTTFNITVTPKALQKMQVQTLPDKIQYVEGQSLDLAGLVLTGTYNNGETTEITEGYTCSPVTLSNIGKQTVTVTYEGLTTTFDVEVIQKKPIGIEIASEPTNKEVVEGSLKLDTTGMQVKVLYDSGFSENISTGFNLVGYEPRVLGEQEITVNYCGFTAKFNITVVPKTISHLEINKSAEKLEFIEGEEFSDYGLVVWGYYNNGDVEEITEYTLSGYDESVGTKNIVIEYEGKSTSYAVTVVEKELIAVDIETMPTKTEYLEDENLDTTGLEVVAVYNNGERILLSDAEYTIDGFDNEPGVKGIYASYGEYSAIFEVTVKEMELTSLTIVSSPTKLEYNIGEELDLSGLSLSATYAHGKTETVDINDCAISGFDKDKAGIQVVLISYRGSNVAFLVNVKQIIEHTAMIKTKNVAAVSGSTIAVPVNIINNTGISNLELNVSYDKSVLTNADIKPSELLSNGTFNVTVSEEMDDFITYTITWSADSDMAKNGTIFTAYFTVSDDAVAGNYPIEVTYNAETTKNKEGKTVKLSCVDGSVDVAEGETIPYVISGEQATVQSGGLLNYEISLANNVGLSSYKLQVLYDTTALDINAVKSGRLFGDFTVDYTEIDGGIEITGTSEGLNKQNGSFLTLEFTAAEGIENATYPISITCTENGNDATIECEEGSVSISGYVLGDINGDGRVNNFDVMMHVGYLSGGQKLAPEQLMAADVTGDGNVDYLDYSSISSYVVGIYEGLNSDVETMGSSLSYASNFVGGANSERAVITASEIFDAQPGEYVTIDVDLSRNPGLSGYVVTMEYDTELLELIDIVQKDTLSGGKFNTNTSVAGEATVMWSDIETHNENGTIFSVTFKLGNTVPEELPLILTYNSEHTGYLNETYTSVPVTLMSQDGVIYVDTESAYMTLDEVVNNGTDISGTVNIYNDAEFVGTADLFIATYDDKGKLVSIKSQDVELTANETSTSDISISAKDAKTLKVFVFEKDSIRPLVKSKSKTF